MTIGEINYTIFASIYKPARRRDRLNPFGPRLAVTKNLHNRAGRNPKKIEYISLIVVLMGSFGYHKSQRQREVKQNCTCRCWFNSCAIMNQKFKRPKLN